MARRHYLIAQIARVAGSELRKVRSLLVLPLFFGALTLAVQLLADLAFLHSPASSVVDASQAALCVFCAGKAFVDVSGQPSIRFLTKVDRVKVDKTYLRAVPVAVGLGQIVTVWAHLGRWDVMLVSGVIVWAICVETAAGMPRRMENALDRLVGRGVICIRDSEDRSIQTQDSSYFSTSLGFGTRRKLWPRRIERFSRRQPGDQVDTLTYAELKEALTRRASRWATTAGMVVAFLIGIIWVIVLSGWPAVDRYRSIWQLGFELLLGWLAGWCIGCLAAYGNVWPYLRSRGAMINLILEHPDGADGLSPLGDAFLYQSGIVSLPSFYLALWWLLIPLWADYYSSWRTLYLWLLIPAVLLEVVSFIIPLFSIHNAMVRQKASLQVGLDQRFSQLLMTANELGSATRKPGDDLIEDYHTVERLRTYPVNFSIRWRFGIRNLLLLVLTLLGFVSDSSQVWDQFAHFLFPHGL